MKTKLTILALLLVTGLAKRLALVEQERKAKEAEEQPIAKMEAEKKAKEDDQKNDGTRFKNFSMQPKGPSVHGFQLGMSYQDFLANLNKLDSRELETRQRGIFSADELVGGDKATIEITVFFPKTTTGERGDVIGVATLGSPRVVVYIDFKLPALMKMLKCGSMSFDEFCQSFIDAYSIPKLAGSTKGSDKWMGYTSPDGWKIGFTKSAYSTSVDLQAVPMEHERGFGR